jgi:hypothetical protein
LVLGDDILELLALSFKNLGKVGNLSPCPLCRGLSFRRPEVGLPIQRLLHVTSASFGKRLLSRLCYKETTVRLNTANNATFKGTRSGYLLLMAISCRFFFAASSTEAVKRFTSA